MMWHGHDISGWGWLAMSVGMVLFWGLVFAGAVIAVRALTRGSGQAGRSGPATGPSAEHILAERYARGEIDDDEYHRRWTMLYTTAPAAGSSLTKS
jgi:putative membrane protein